MKPKYIIWCLLGLLLAAGGALGQPVDSDTIIITGTVIDASEKPDCDDDIDNDGDTRVDWDGGGVGLPDLQCQNDPNRVTESVNSNGGCGLGLEVAPLLLAAGLVRVRRRGRRRGRSGRGACA